MIFNEISNVFLSVLSINVGFNKSTKEYKIPKRVCNFVKHSFVCNNNFVHFGCNIYRIYKKPKFLEGIWQKE